MKMNRIKIQSCSIFICLLFTGAGLTHAQTSSAPAGNIRNGNRMDLTPPPSATEASGTVISFSPGEIKLASPASTAGVRYTCSKFTRFVDARGNPVATDTIQPGTSVTINFAKDRSEMAAFQVVVH